jgi:hypothetical protein
MGLLWARHHLSSITMCKNEEMDVCEEDLRMGGLVICDLLHAIDYGGGLLQWM